jgi:branched-chain amino acid transport system substrate-binding protein
MWKKSLKYVLPLIICLVFLIAFIPGCKQAATTTAPTSPTASVSPTHPKPADYDTRKSIVFGGARPVSGPMAIFEQTSFGPIYKMWVNDVNAAGGLYVAEYGRKLPIELKIEDDGSDLGTSQRLIEKLILEDKIDFLLPNCSTAFLYASAPIANKYGKVYVTGEGGATTLTAMLPTLPYVFCSLNYADYYQLPVLADTLAAKGVKKAALVYLNDLHGIEYDHTAYSEFTRVGISIVMNEAIPPFTTDVEVVMKEAKASGADVFCGFVYPPSTEALVKEAIALDYNPSAMVLGPGCSAEYFKCDLTTDVVQGLTGFGAFNRKSSAALNTYVDHFVSVYGPAGLSVFNDDLGMIDWWGSAIYYAALQCLQQAIEKAGTLDNSVVKDVMATNHFQTIYGDTWFYRPGGTVGGGILAKECHPGEIGQWQAGIYEVVGYDGINTLLPSYKITASYIYPKPAWPK